MTEPDDLDYGAGPTELGEAPEADTAEQGVPADPRCAPTRSAAGSTTSRLTR
jgi:hypothetical protein